jgi:hypothetical protein
MRQYVKQLNDTNFVYPNNTIAEYDVDIVHQINNNTVTGTSNSFATTSVSSSSISFSLNYTWTKNSADVFILGNGELSLLSVHMMGATQQYYKPWRMVHNVSNVNTSLTGTTATTTFTVTPSQLGLASFTTGTYFFDIRFVGKRAVYPICTSLNITV